MNQKKIEEIREVANTLRGLSIDAIQKANSGHPGLPLGMADVLATLWFNGLNISGKDPKWLSRDRLVFSGGHGSALLYSFLHLAGYDVSIDDLKSFRQWGSKTPGHPEFGCTSGVEVTTGPLGQGLANGVGMALSRAMLSARMPKDDEGELFDHTVYVLCGDGDMEEGISHEAASFAGAMALSNLVVLYDSNEISIEGDVKDCFRDDTAARFKSYGWYVTSADGHDPASITKALRAAKKHSNVPVLIVCKTQIGFGSPNRAGKAKVHGEPLGVDELKLTKQALGLPVDKDFYVSDAVRAACATKIRAGKRMASKWNRRFSACPGAREAFEELTHIDWSKLSATLPKFPVDKPIATRAASGKVLQSIAAAVPSLIGGSADLAPSNKTWLDAFGAVTAGDFSGRNIHYGIRELAMAAIQNGILVDGVFRAFTATFFVFSDYMKPAMRIAAISKHRAIYVFSHDSFHVGEDGATHEPVEQLASLRATPGLTVIRPADATETVAAWLAALNASEPVALLLSRQNLPVLDRAALPSASLLERGAYTLWQNSTGEPEIVIMASGGEVAIALEAARQRPERNIRVVSFPSWELFAKQPQSYRDEVLPPSCRRRIVVEAAASFGWERYLGSEGKALCLDHFGDSAPASVLAKKFGFTVEGVLSLVDSF